ncbi:uncharacterized protein LOC118407900 [Branchiostoma floridae]|uniref:Uncharacterized protein LOC118407900 n=1 Tax=Branchiostoma floridae TaxID=7739 RepID=A0A9J7HTZ6_BRAFL|nr:uncharacterized protein LOC118407900 [Branchiostoma floridae]
MALRKSTRTRRSAAKDDFEYGPWSFPRARVERREPRENSDPWPIIEVVSRVDANQVIVKWAGDWPNSVVDLRFNPELEKQLQANCCHPGVKVFKEEQLLFHDNDELALLKQGIFDNLNYRYTASVDEGHQRRVTVTVPFSENNFRALFLQQLSMPLCKELLEEHPLENCFSRQRAISLPYDKMEEMNTILGKNWDVRTFPTNTVCRVVQIDGVHISWGYKKRETFSHKECPRCNWEESSGSERPDSCTPKLFYFVGKAEMNFSFTRQRVHWEAADEA